MLTKSFQCGPVCWLLKEGNILDESADVLICSANVSLDLSGGVGADLLGRYGSKMQNELRRMISDRTPRLANQGDVFFYFGKEIPYKAVIHAVAVDGWYQATPEIVRKTIERALSGAAEVDAQKVALTALATGFGNLTLGGFADAIRPLLSQRFGLIQQVCICLMEDYRIAQLANCLLNAES